MLPIHERSFLYTYLAHTLQTGLSSRQALNAYTDDVKMNEKYAKELKRALFLLTKKTSIASALYGARVIPHAEWRIIMSFGKNHPLLAKIFQELSSHLRKEHIIQRKIKALMIYPLILASELALMIAVLIFWLSPNLASFSKSLTSAPPLFIVFLYSINRAAIHLANARVLFTALALAIGFAFILKRAKHHSRYALEWTIARLYKLERIYRIIMSVKIIHLLALLMEHIHKPSFGKALRITGEAIPSPQYSCFLLQFAKHIETGGSIASFAKSKKNTKFFPTLAWRFLIIGERSKTMTQKLKTLSEILHEELDINMKHTISALEPLLVVVIALIVGTLAFFLQQTISNIESAVLLQ